MRNIIFDVGKVLVSYEPEEMMKGLGFTEEEIATVNAAMFENAWWEKSDRGDLPREDLHKAFINEAKTKEDKALVERAYQHIGETIDLLPHTMQWILDLKKRGYHIYILSNYSEDTFEKTKDKLNRFLDLVDGAIFSYECKMSKPEPGIYKKLISEYFLEEDESVFIDDRKANVEAAEALGIKGILFTNYVQAMAELDTYLINH